jgi:hypothetical protein
MKICPHCQTTYTDDSLQFCLQDGSSLTPVNTQSWSEAETLVSPKYTTNKNEITWQQSAPNADSYDALHSSAPPRKSRTGLTVALTVLVTLLVVGSAVAGFLIYRHNTKTDTAQNINTNVKPPASPSPNNSNVNQKANANTNVNANASPVVTPSAKPTLNPKEADTIRSNVKDVIDNWNDASENRDLDVHLANYANTVDYYKAGKVGIAKVREDKQKAYSIYDNIEINIDNVKITPDANGENAVAVFDKEWNFQNDEKTNSGKVQQQLTFSKINGAWRITGEKDLKIYYVNK